MFYSEYGVLNCDCSAGIAYHDNVPTEQLWFIDYNAVFTEKFCFLFLCLGFLV